MGWGWGMKRLIVALGLAVLAAAAQAQTADDRFPRPSHENPSLVTALRNWLASKSAAQKPADKRAAEQKLQKIEPPPVRPVAAAPRPHRRYRVHHYRVPETRAPKAATMAPPAAPTLASVTPAAPIEAPPVETPAPGASVNRPAPVAAPIPSPATTASIAPTASAPTRSLTPEDLNMPRPVATITVMAPSVMAPRPSATRPGHGRSQCTTGERIITAYYWEGRHTASGARFNPDGMTAAHRSFPFGTKLLVINPRNGKSVTVTVNDRGPFVRGITLDLSRGAAKAIGLQGNAAVCMAKL
jgi:rare lipoprotein A